MTDRLMADEVPWEILEEIAKDPNTRYELTEWERYNARMMAQAVTAPRGFDANAYAQALKPVIHHAIPMQANFNYHYTRFVQGAYMK